MEVSILTLLDEPPSQTRLKKLISGTLSVIRTYKLNKTVNLFISIVLISLLTTGVLIHRSFQVRAATQPQSTQERIRYVLSAYFDLSSIKPAPLNTAFSAISVSGVNTGGPAVTSLETQQYVVVAGDSLSAIAAQRGLNIYSITLANPGLDSTKFLQVGQILTIPTKDASLADLAVEQQKQTKPVITQKVFAQVSAPSDTSASTTQGCGVLSKPVDYIYESQLFSKAHPARDMVAHLNTPAYAVADGVVFYTAHSQVDYGNHVAINIDNTNCSVLYAHLNSYVVAQGDHVTRGQLIGYVGTTGRSTGPHLHFELHIDGVAVDPGM